MICDYLLDFEIKLIEPTYTIDVYAGDVLIRKLGAYQIIENDLLKAYLLAMKLEKADPQKGSVTIKSRDKTTHIEARLDSKEKLIIL
tara:strand:- start:1707 stop:1967 length:261 start_codon:yes stop_codon:yes gene_type:complete